MDAVGGHRGEGRKPVGIGGAEEGGVDAGSVGGLEVVKVVADHEGLGGGNGEFSGDVEDAVGVGFVGGVITGGNVVEDEFVTFENAMRAVARVTGEERREDSAVMQGGEEIGGTVVEAAGFGSGHFVTVKNGMGVRLQVRGEGGDGFEDGAFFGQAEVAADGSKVEEFFGERAVHIEDGKSIGHRFIRLKMVLRKLLTKSASLRNIVTAEEAGTDK